MARETVTEEEREYFYSGRRLPILYLNYLKHLKEIQKQAVGTIQNKKKPVLSFLNHFSKNNTPATIGKIKPADIQEYTLNTAQKKTRSEKRKVVSSLRDFLSYIYFEGYSDRNLAKSVPTIVTYRLSTIPKGMPWKVVQEILKVPNRRTFCGKRDYAMILMFARYGVRAIQMRELRLSNINWEKKTILFKARKGGKDILAPLFPDVAKALLAYFKAGRMKAPKKYDHVFLTSGTFGSAEMGQRPLAESTWNIVNRALKKLDVDTSFRFKKGPHSIRHSYATRLLGKDEPIKNISDLLGHKSIKTTFIYTKSSVSHLRFFTRSWPQGGKIHER